MRYSEFKITERRRSEKGQPRVDRRIDGYDAVSDKTENTARELLKYEKSSRRNQNNYSVDNLYVSFTGIEKLGVNPRSGYNTPLGIYSYPLNYVIKGIKDSGGHVNVEYMGTQPYVWVFAPRNPSAGLDIATYSQSQFKRDLEKLKKFVLSQGFTDEEYLEIEERSQNTAKRLDAQQGSQWAASLWNISRIMGDALADRKLKMKIGFQEGDYVVVDSDYVDMNLHTKLQDPVVAIVRQLVLKSGVSKPFARVSIFRPGTTPLNKEIPLKHLKKTAKPENIPKNYLMGPGDTVQIVDPNSPYYGKIGTIFYVYENYKELEVTLQGFKSLHLTMDQVELYDPNKPAVAKVSDKPDVAKVSDKPAEKKPISSIKQLFDKGKQTGVITYAELDAVVGPDASAEEIDDIIDMASEIGINIVEGIGAVNTSTITEWKKERDEPARQKTVEWNRLLRILGYEYVTDSRGSGLIHGNEPTQAVFFSGKYITPVEKIYNSESVDDDEMTYDTSVIGIDKKYDRVKFERWFKKNWKKQHPWNWDEQSLEFKSPKLQIALLNKDAEWADKFVSVAKETKKYITDRAESFLKNPSLDFKKIEDIIEILKSIDTDFNIKKFKKIKRHFASNSAFAKFYLKNIDTDATSFPEAEPELAENSETAVWYAKNILKKRFKAAEPQIIKHLDWAMQYVIHFKERIPEFEQEFKKYPNTAFEYAIRVLEKPWPEAELTIASSKFHYEQYRHHFPLFKKPEDVKAGTKIAVRKYIGGILAEIADDGYEEVSYLDQKIIRVKFATTTDEISSKVSINEVIPLTKDRHGFTLGDMIRISADDKNKYMLIETNPSEGKYTVKDKYGDPKDISNTEVFLNNPDQFQMPKDHFVAGDLVHVSEPYSEYYGKLLPVKSVSPFGVTVFDKNNYSSNVFKEKYLRHATLDDIKKANQ